MIETQLSLFPHLATFIGLALCFRVRTFHIIPQILTSGQAKSLRLFICLTYITKQLEIVLFISNQNFVRHLSSFLNFIHSLNALLL